MSEIYQANQRQQLQMLRETTRLTGALHEAQVLQLKMWPMVCFDHALGSKFTWDPDKKVVAFTVETPKKGRNPPLAWWQQRVTALNSWVQELLGAEWYIEVKVTGKKTQTFRGSRNISGAINSNRPDAG